MDENDVLAPAAFHCPNPSHFQSFHFGLHKISKVMQNGIDQKKYSSANNHIKNIIEILKIFNRDNALSHTYALAGVLTGIEIKVDHTYINFNNEKMVKAFLDLEKKENETIQSIIHWTQTLPKNEVLLHNYFLLKYFHKRNLFITNFQLFFYKIKVETKELLIKFKILKVN
jgi:hypothetical protein